MTDYTHISHDTVIFVFFVVQIVMVLCYSDVLDQDVPFLKRPTTGTLFRFECLSAEFLSSAVFVFSVLILDSLIQNNHQAI